MSNKKQKQPTDVFSKKGVIKIQQNPKLNRDSYTGVLL